MLRTAEERFGVRDKDYSVLGIEFGESGPFIWYPGNCKNIAIQLSIGSMASERCALYELAHECIHLLTPTGKGTANYLEEGLAVYFSWQYVKEVLNFDYKTVIQPEDYKRAGLLVEKLLNQNPDFIRQARKFQNCISLMDHSVFEKVQHNLSKQEVNQLVLAF